MRTPPYANRRGVFLRPLLWLMPWLFLLAVVGSLLPFWRAEFNGGTRASSGQDLERGPDGTLVESESKGIFGAGGGSSLSPPSPSLPPVVEVSLNIRNAEMPRRMWFQFGEGCWSRTEWMLDIRPQPSFPPLTPADRAQIAAKCFERCEEDVPPGASAAPPPGETALVGYVTDVHYGLLALWLLTGAPGVVLIAWFLTGFAYWIARNNGHKWMLCGGCGYNRSGLTKETPCPECGAGGMHAVCPECGKAP